MNNTIPHQRAILAMEDRAAQRLKAAERLQELIDKERSGLVKEELQRGVARMLDQQLEYLQAAQKMRKQFSGFAQGSLI